MTQPTNAIERLHNVRKFLEAEYRDPAAEVDGEWLAKEVREPHANLCEVIATLEAPRPVDDQMAMRQALKRIQTIVVALRGGETDGADLLEVLNLTRVALSGDE